MEDAWSWDAFPLEEDVCTGLSGHGFSSDLPDEHLCVCLFFYVVFTWDSRYMQMIQGWLDL